MHLPALAFSFKALFFQPKQTKIGCMISHLANIRTGPFVPLEIFGWFGDFAFLVLLKEENHLIWHFEKGEGVEFVRVSLASIQRVLSCRVLNRCTTYKHCAHPFSCFFLPSLAVVHKFSLHFHPYPYFFYIHHPITMKFLSAAASLAISLSAFSAHHPIRGPFIFAKRDVCPVDVDSCSSASGGVDTCCLPKNGFVKLSLQWHTKIGPADAFTVHGKRKGAKLSNTYIMEHTAGFAGWHHCEKNCD